MPKPIIHICGEREMRAGPEPIDIGFDLKSPCDDCPFTKDAAPHQGIAKSLPEYIKKFDEGMLAHSCHKTDSRADSENPKLFKGKVQHCIGMILMAEKSKKIQKPYFLAFLKKKFKIEDLKGRERVFTRQQFIQAYIKFLKKLQRERKRA